MSEDTLKSEEDLNSKESGSMTSSDEKKTILLIDDDVDARETIAQMLIRSGFEVREANNGDEGIATFRTHQCSLVITDLVMPEKDGIEVITTLQRDFRDIPIIAISGGLKGYEHSANVLLPLAQQKGAIRIVKKPFTRHELLDVVKEAIESGKLPPTRRE